MKAAINDVAAIQPAVGGGAAVAAPAVGGLAPAIGAGGGGGCHPGGSGDGAAPAAPAAAPAIGAGAGGGSSGDGAASAALPAVGNNTVPGASSSLPAVGNNTVPGASSSLPVVGGNQKLHGIMSDWDVNGMVSLLESISLGHLSKAFIENGLDGAFSSSARRRSWPRLVLPHCSSRKSWPTRRVGRKINEPAVGGSLPSSRWRFSSLAWPALAENAHT